ncbi:HET-domain-containing protein [Aspergillus campestris IBT 28561]|uniref:HET-domain-containing protein n=1 Tax=Aspergillus campestris (strain IBT 28561) TaxID=1392248 RepID=A0A2I1CXT8_ASPC2|nr:HET-domain-containing protein [Aspergillus campestris IBT 28561]PKY02449.1 HET-domain-containing protein [Aspergillus campestris IBT 28561]
MPPFSNRVMGTKSHAVLRHPALAQYPPAERIRRLLAQPLSASLMDPSEILVFPEEQMLCPVCYNLDPRRAPSDDGKFEQAWARAEYRIPDDASVAIVEIDTPTKLLESARNGCFHCPIVASVLGAIHPGWEAEKTFLDIFLASGLPVVVRLQFGTRSTKMLASQATGDLGFHLPLGQDVGWSVTVDPECKSTVDIEIYRPVVPEGLKLVSDIALAPLVHNIGFAEDIPDDGGMQHRLAFIKNQVSLCVRQHQCARNSPVPLLPDRVLWVAANNATRIQLVEPENVRALYLTLSYCWGSSLDATACCTTAQTLASRKAGIAFDELPPLFQDVVMLARHLAIEYVWIDRLCILQGHDGDFHAQSAQMAEIFGNATLTIAAASASSVNDRMVQSRMTRHFQASAAGSIGTLRLHFRRRSHPLRQEPDGGDYGAISRRAWIWQERLLSARTVFFTPGGELKFECRHHSVWEGFAPGCTGHSWSARLDRATQAEWTALVEEYMRRDITRPSDRLPAIQAVMKRVAERTGWRPFWGVWEDALPSGLGWRADYHAEGSICEMTPAHYAPSWSWASVVGPISYALATPPATHAVSVMDGGSMRWDLTCQVLDRDSERIQISGRAVFVELHAVVEESCLDGREQEQKRPCKYKLKGRADNQQDLSITADVPLKPWYTTIDGKEVSTVVRVPYGEMPPDQSWSAPCAAISLGRRMARHLVLFVGLSMRTPGALERIGLADGILGATFSGCPTWTIDLV